MPPPNVTVRPMPFGKYKPFVPIGSTTARGPTVVHRQGPAVVLGRPARRQPGAHRSDGPRSQAPHVRSARRDGLQGDRGRFPVGQPARLRLRAPAHRGGPDSRRRDDPGAHAMPPGADRAHIREHPGCAACDRALLQLDEPAATARSCSASSSPTSSTSPSTPPVCAASSRRQHPRHARFATSTRRRASRSPSPTSRSRSARR